MRLLFCIYFLLFTTASILSGQTISGKFTTKPSSNGYVILSSYFGMDHQKIDSVKLAEDGSFKFENLELAKGLYRISTRETIFKDVLYNPNEKEISFQFNDVNDLAAGTVVLNSEENKLLTEWEKKKKYIKGKIKDINDAIRAKPKNAIDEKQQLVLMRDSFRVYEQEYLKYLLDKKAQDGQFFKELYDLYLFPDFETAKQNGNSIKYPNQKAFLKANFFNKLDFGNEQFKRTKVFPEMAWYYINNYTAYNEKGFIRSINKIMDATAGDDETKQHMLKFLLKKFHTNGPKVVFQYMVENFLLEGACGDVEIDDEVALMAKLYESLLPGNKAPNIQMKDANEQMISVDEIAKKKLGTILFFWSSHCKYCKEAVPTLKQIYALYKDKGIEVVGISLDTYKPHWTQAIEQYQLNWVNVTDYKAWKSDAVDTFKVHKTPYFYLISSDMTIISKPATVGLLKRDVERLVK